MNDRERQELIEIYKLHAHLADQVSNRREGANRLHVSLLVGLLSVVAIIIRFGPDEVVDWRIFVIVGVLGTLLSLSWWLVIRSYKQLNANKFRVLGDLETMLPFEFFNSEWDPEQAGRKSNQYLELTKVENFLPMMFGAFFVAMLAYAVYSTC